MDLAFLGTPEFAVPSLERLVAAGHRIRLVITQPDRPAGRGRTLTPPPIKQAAERLGLAVYQPERLSEALGPLREAAVEAAIVAAYGEVLTRETLAVPSRGFLNLHPSLLPRHRGPTPVPGAILGGDDVTGVTVMLVTPGVDSGPILSQSGHPVRADDTGASLLGALGELGADLLVETLPRWDAGELAPRTQDPSAATYTRTLRREDGLADWTLPAVEIWRRCRAFQPWPGLFTRWEEKTLRLITTSVLASRRGHAPGQVFSTETGIAVACGTGALLLGTVQLEGRPAMAAEDLARGHRTLPGARLG